MSGRMYILVGPSGSGKNAVLDAVKKRHPEVVEVVGATTRPPREGERDGIHYHFVSERRFLDLEQWGELLESSEFQGNHYGTPVEPVTTWLRDGRIVANILDIRGTRGIKERLGDKAVTIFVSPGSTKTLRSRLMQRKGYRGENLEWRLAIANKEMLEADSFDHLLANEDDLDAAVAELERMMGLL